MKRVIEISTICIITLVLAGSAYSGGGPETGDSQGEQAKSNFPSQRLYKVDSCDIDEDTRQPKCGSFVIGSEFAIVQETDGPIWRLWLKRPGDQPIQLCAGKIDKDVFWCKGLCGNLDNYLKIFELDPSECAYNHCVRFKQEGNACPDGGSGRGGHN